MFMPVPFDSINSRTLLASGRYGVTCVRYSRDADAATAILFYFTPSIGGPQPAAVDLLVIERGGAVRARDFLWMPDRSWRDSDGVRANRLEALLPAELLGLQVAGNDVLDDVIVGDAS